MLIDTHCHLDAIEFLQDRSEVIQRARHAGVGRMVIPAVEAGNFDEVRQLAHAVPEAVYALGIHPLFVPQAAQADLNRLEAALAANIHDPKLVAVGEIGLDFFVPELRVPAMVDKQIRFYEAQLDLAVKFNLPVILHVRRSQDALLKGLRRRPFIGGTAHAFNGSFQQAQQFIGLGFALGIGGAMTFERALRIRRLATQLPLENLVLETDAPDIPPAWLGTKAGVTKDSAAKGAAQQLRNEPAQLYPIAQTLAGLRDMPLEDIAAETTRAAYRVLPRLAALC
ncbi:TatD family hydrolase [Pusillimonas sp. DMV24BSW_D]|uniref:TatD family hydrolase n=1 Tax=Neopusillimonas aestuarii TaxID=2716226 RepID=UPI001407CD08|nr:TatD family hydrolase [Pusillimonas sp. DMV24BSW_D]QIM49506.1 TatD family hydrolase [Pusillimonas sp. DMV24BSW_D]